MVIVSEESLKDFGRMLIAETKEKLEAEILAQKNERYLSPEQTANMLAVDVSTLWRWAKREYLIPISVGGKKRYRFSDIKNILEGRG